jgi:hypothetical protein
MGHYTGPKTKNLASRPLRYDVSLNPFLSLSRHRSSHHKIQAIPFQIPPSFIFDIPMGKTRFERVNSHYPIYWTILVLTPIWYSRLRQKPSLFDLPMVGTTHIKIDTLHVTALDLIKTGLRSAVESCIEIGDYLEGLLRGEDTFLNPEAHDKFCFYNYNNLSQSKKMLLDY